MNKIIAMMTALLIQGTAFAATSYTYVGSYYTSPTGVYTTSMRVTGSFTTANPLPANMPLTQIGPLGNGLVQSWSFNDGVNTYTQANSAELYGSPNLAVSTDGGGEIVAYTVSFMSPLPPHSVGTLMNGFFLNSDGVLQAVTDSPCDEIVGNGCTSIPVGGTGTVNEIGSGSFSRAAIPIPTLSQWGLLLMSLLLVVVGAGQIARRRM